MELKEKQLKRREIIQCKRNLAKTDYKVIKYLEGLLPTMEYLEIKAQREKWREQINIKESELNE